MISAQYLSFAFRRVLNSRVQSSVGTACFTMILLPTRFRLTILDNVFTLTFYTAIYNYLRYHVSRIPSVKYLPLPNFLRKVKQLG